MFFMLLFAVYFSSLLATLNRREKVRTQMKGPNGIVTLPISGIAWHSQSISTQPMDDQSGGGISQVRLTSESYAVLPVTIITIAWVRSREPCLTSSSPRLWLTSTRMNCLVRGWMMTLCVHIYKEQVVTTIDECGLHFEKERRNASHWLSFDTMVSKLWRAIGNGRSHSAEVEFVWTIIVVVIFWTPLSFPSELRFYGLSTSWFVFSGVRYYLPCMICSVYYRRLSMPWMKFVSPSGTLSS